MVWWALVLVGCGAQDPKTSLGEPVENLTEEISDGDEGAVPEEGGTALGESPAGTVMFGLANMPGHGYRGEIIEIDREGNEVWKYTLPESINPGNIGLQDRLMDVEPHADGTILFSVNGMGFYRINRAGELLWHLPDPLASHDVDLLESGNILATHARAARGQPLVVEYTPDGELVWSWDGTDFFTDPAQVSFQDETGAWAHVNSVRLQDNGNIRLCVRNFNVILEVDRSGEVVDAVWFDGTGDPRSITVGPSTGIRGSRPHEPFTRKARSRYVVALRRPARVIEFDRDKGKIRRVWHAPVDDPTFAKIRDINLLPGGNWLITTYDHIIEVNVEHEVVWKYSIDVPDAFASYPDLASLHKASFIDKSGIVYGN